MNRTSTVFFLAALSFSLVSACDKSSSMDADSPSNPGGTDTRPGTKSPRNQPEVMPMPSGSRLRSVYFKGDDGSREHIYWFDTKLEISCEYRSVAWDTSASGIEAAYCIPYMIDFQRCSSGESIFLDSNCTTVLYRTWAHDASQEYFEITEQSGDQPCDDKPAGFYRIKKVHKSGNYFYKNFSGECTPVVHSGGWSEFVELGDSVAPEIFVRAETLIHR